MSKKFPKKILFQISGINKSSYYKWIANSVQRAKIEQKEAIITEAIKEMYIKHKGCYGVERMTKGLRIEKDIYCNHKKVYRIMKESGYLSVIKPKKNYTKAGKPHPKHKYIASKRFTHKYDRKQRNRKTCNISNSNENDRKNKR